MQIQIHHIIVIPAKAGIQDGGSRLIPGDIATWTPTCVGVTGREVARA